MDGRGEPRPAGGGRGPARGRSGGGIHVTTKNRKMDEWISECAKSAPGRGDAAGLEVALKDERPAPVHEGAGDNNDLRADRCASESGALGSPEANGGEFAIPRECGGGRSTAILRGASGRIRAAGFAHLAR